MTNQKKQRENYTEKEVDKLLKKAENLDGEYFRLRAQCLVAIAYRFGKRRIEISRLRINDFSQTKTDLEIKFTLAKKRKRGLHQFIEVCRKKNPEILKKSLLEIENLHKDWQQTEAGHKIIEQTALKSLDLQDKYTKYILNYLEYVKKHYPDSKFLFPSGYNVFGNYTVDTSEHISGSQLLRVLKTLTNSGWMHLFRNTKAEQTARFYGRTLESLHNVAETLNVTDQTAMVYIRRHVPQKQPIIN